MGTDFNIQTLLIQTFLPYVRTYPGARKSAEASNAPAAFQNVLVEENNPEELSSMGTPLWFPIRFQAGTYQVFDRGQVKDVDMAEYRLPVTCICECVRSKVINETQLSGGAGSVKEIFGHTDWQIRIKGLLIPEPKHPQNITSASAHEDMLKRYDDLVSSVKVNAEFLNSKDIFDITIKSISFTQIPGSPDVRGFSIEAVSDYPAEIQQLLI